MWFSLILLEVIEFFKCAVSCVFSNLSSFWSLFLQIIFLALSFFPLFLGLPLCMCWYAWQCPRILLDCVHFSSFFFPLSDLRLYNFNWPVFNFIDSLFCLLRTVIWTLWWAFHFSYYTLQVQNFCLVTFYNFYLFIDFLYLLEVIFTSFSSFLMVSFSSLSILNTGNISLCLVSSMSASSGKIPVDFHYE